MATEDGLEQAGAHSSSSLGALQQQLQQASQSLFGYGSLDGEGRKQLLQQLQAGVLQQVCVGCVREAGLLANVCVFMP